MAVEYRRECAVLAMRIKELREIGANPTRINTLSEMLRETREVADTLEGYYTGCRSPRITMERFYAAKVKRKED